MKRMPKLAASKADQGREPVLYVGRKRGAAGFAICAVAPVGFEMLPTVDTILHVLVPADNRCERFRLRLRAPRILLSASLSGKIMPIKTMRIEFDMLQLREGGWD